MPFTKELNKDFKLENKTFKLTPEYLKEYLTHPKKITGGKVFSLMKKDPWKTPFQTWCEMVGIYKEKSDDFVVNAGIVIEDKIFDFAKQYLGMDWSAFDAKDRGFDEFSGAFEGFDKNEIFGGLLDGVPANNDMPILEIKTAAKNKWSWKKDRSRGDGLFVVKDENGWPVVKTPEGGYSKFYPNGIENGIEIPQAYQYQLGLYCYLKHNPKGIFAVSYLDDKDYLHPEQFVASPSTVKFKAFVQDLDQYEQSVINPLTEWYKKHVLTGISPEMTDQDRRWLIDKMGFYQYNKMKIEADKKAKLVK